MNSQQGMFEFAETPEWQNAANEDVMVAEVVFNLPLERPYTYAIPDAIRDRIKAGQRVKAPLGRGNRNVVGYCVAVRSADQAQRVLKPITELLDSEPLLARPIMSSDLAVLTGLDASNRGITNLSGLEYATNLRWLDLSHNQITSLAALEPAASSLLADANADLGPRWLEYLSLDDNSIQSLEPISLVTKLKVLSADDNWIVDLKPMQNFVNLQTLSLDRQKDPRETAARTPLDMSPLSSLAKLESLSLASAGSSPTDRCQRRSGASSSSAGTNAARGCRSSSKRSHRCGPRVSSFTSSARSPNSSG